MVGVGGRAWRVPLLLLLLLLLPPPLSDAK
jgi:hypothetical protein